MTRKDCLHLQPCTALGGCLIDINECAYYESDSALNDLRHTVKELEDERERRKKGHSKLFYELRAENERLRERLLRKTCISRLPNCTDAGMGDDSSVVGYCPLGYHSGEYCDAVRRVVES